MRLPPGKRTGRQAAVRYTDDRGRRQRVVDRGIYLVSRGWLQKVIAGTGKDFEWQQTHDGPWHPIHATVEEAIDYLTRGDDKLGIGRKTVRRCLAIRQRRQQAGKVVF